MSCRRALGLVLMCAWAVGAARAVDFSAGFAELRAAGLPDVAGAEYVRLDRMDPQVSSSSGLYDLRQDGNAWKTADLGPGRARFVVESAQVLDVADARSARSATNPAPTGALGTWRPANLSNDLNAVTTYLADLAKDEYGQRRLADGNGGAGRLLLWAAHAQRAGFTNQANDIADALFRLVGDSRRVVVQAISEIADGAYIDAYTAFKQQGDRAAFLVALRGLLAQYPAGWQKREAVQHLADLVAGQGAHTNASGLPDGQWSETERRIARSLLEKPADERAMFGWRSGNIWILPAAADDADDSPPVGDSVFSDIQAQGPAILPLLIALVTDSTLTGWGTDDLKMIFGSSYYFSSSEPVEDMNARLFLEMDRPALRSDMARKFLEPLLISGEKYGSPFARMSAEEFQSECRSWYEAYGSNTLTQLAQVYLEEGSRAQRTAAIQYLLAHAGPEDLVALQTHLVDPDDPNESFQAVMEYAVARGAEARGFVEDYIQRLDAAAQDALANMADAMDSDMDSDDVVDTRGFFLAQYSNQVAQLRGAISATSAADLLRDVAAGKESLESMQVLLAQRMTKMPPGQVLSNVLAAAVAAPDPDTRVALIRFLPRLSVGQGAAMGRSRQGQRVGAPWDLRANADLWRQLLDDQRLTGGNGDPTMTVSDVTAELIQMVCNFDDFMRNRGVMLLGPMGRSLLKQRAMLRLDGRTEIDLPPLPQAAIVAPQRTAELAAEMLNAGPATNLAAVLADVQPGEWLALMEREGTNAALRTAWLPLANKVVGVICITGQPPLALQSMVGQVLSRTLVEAVQDHCRKEVMAGCNVMAVIQRLPCLQGLQIVIADPKLIPNRGDFDLPPQLNARQPTLVAWLHLPGFEMVQTEWSLGPAAEVLNAPAPVSGPEDLLGDAVNEIVAEIRAEHQQDDADFWSGVDRFCAGQGNLLAPASILWRGWAPTQSPGPESSATQSIQEEIE